MLKEYELVTERRMQMIDITEKIEKDLDISEGICIIYTPHTTCGITINENADPAVCNDMIYGFEKAFPTSDPYYHHAEGNSHAHMKSTVFNCTQSVIIHDKKLMLGIWQGIYLCEFDGPRTRKVWMKTIQG